MPERLLLNRAAARARSALRKGGAPLAAGLALLCVLCAGPASARAGTEDDIRAAVAEETDRSALRQAFSAMAGAAYPGDSFPRLLQLARDLAAAGIRVDDLASKVQEGVAKKVPPDRVMSVLTERANRLKDGRVLVLDLVSEGTVFLDQQMAFRVMADYLARGISREELRKRVLSHSLADYPALENVIR